MFRKPTCFEIDYRRPSPHSPTKRHTILGADGIYTEQTRRYLCVCCSTPFVIIVSVRSHTFSTTLHFMKKLLIGASSLLTTISKLLGLIISLASTGVKIPQILRLVKARSVHGLTMSMFGIELLSQEQFLLNSYSIPSVLL